MLTKILTSIGGVFTISFGIWHFFVPAQWNWYSYIAADATELVIAVRAINIFFSLCLVLFGIANIIFVFANHRFTTIVMLGLTSILWAARCITQIVCPQGSMTPLLQYGLLAAFIVIFLCFFVSLGIVILFKK